jgi:CheY-like chemotaxis protein
VNDGREAVEACARERFDVVIMDLQMPGMDGIAATTAIRARERETGGRVPIIAYTALARESDRVRCEQAGMDAYLAKPVRIPELVATIGRMLAASTPPSVPPALDASVLRESVGEDPAALLRAVELFTGESRAMLQQLRDGCGTRNAGAVAWAAHRLRGSLAMVGAGPAAAVAARLEQQGSDGDVDGARATLAALERELDRLTPALAAVARRGESR